MAIERVESSSSTIFEFESILCYARFDSTRHRAQNFQIDSLDIKQSLDSTRLEMLETLLCKNQSGTIYVRGCNVQSNHSWAPNPICTLQTHLCAIRTPFYLLLPPLNITIQIIYRQPGFGRAPMIFIVIVTIKSSSFLIHTYG